MNNDSNTLSKISDNIHNINPSANTLSAVKWEDITGQINFYPSPNFSLEQLLEHARHIPSPYKFDGNFDTNLALKISHSLVNIFAYLNHTERHCLKLGDKTLIQCMLYPILETEPELCECIMDWLMDKRSEASLHLDFIDRMVDFDKFGYTKTAVSAFRKGYSPFMSAGYIPTRLLPYQFRPDLGKISSPIMCRSVQDYVRFQVIPKKRHLWTPDNIKLINEELSRLLLIGRTKGYIAMDEYICCYSPDKREDCTLKALLDLCPILLRFICENLRPLVDGQEGMKNPHHIAMDVQAHEGDPIYLYVANVIRFFSERIEIGGSFEKAREYLPDHLRDFAPIIISLSKPILKRKVVSKN